jgi:hypothetical protein
MKKDRKTLIDCSTYQFTIFNRYCLPDLSTLVIEISNPKDTSFMYPTQLEGDEETMNEKRTELKKLLKISEIKLPELPLLCLSFRNSGRLECYIESGKSILHNKFKLVSNFTKYQKVEALYRESSKKIKYITRLRKPNQTKHMSSL